MHLLLAEDNPMNIDFFRAVLEGDGHHVTVAKDGLTARHIALRERFDLVILDIHLPGLAGDALCAELRAAGVQGPIIALSAAALPSDIAGAKEKGFDAYLTKPISAAALREAVRHHGAAANDSR